VRSAPATGRSEHAGGHGVPDLLGGHRTVGFFDEAACGRQLAEPGASGRMANRATQPLPPDRGGHSLTAVDEDALLQRITVSPSIFGGKPIIRGRRLAVEHVLGMLAAGDTPEAILKAYPWLEAEDIQACLVYAYRLVGHERVVPTVANRTT